MTTRLGEMHCDLKRCGGREQVQNEGRKGFEGVCLQESERETKQGKGREGKHAKGVEMHIQQQGPSPSLLTKATNGVFRVVRLTEFEILFVMFFAIVFLLFKDLVC
jgi:hypothetical protein